MSDEEAAVAMLKALASVQRLVDHRSGNDDKIRGHVLVRETPLMDPPHAPGARFGVWIAVFLRESRADGRVAEWCCEAWRSPDSGQWQTERDVYLNESPVGEPIYTASTELPPITFPDTAALAEALPKLVDDLLETPAPTTE